MADKVEYVITIRTEGGEGGSGSNGGVSKTKDGEDVSGLQSIEMLQKTALLVAGRKAIKTVFTSYLTHVEIGAGNSLLSQKLAFHYGEIERMLAIGTALIGGAVTGNIPAMVGGVAAIASRLTDIGLERQRLALSRSVEDVGIQMANIRAGSNGDRSSGFDF